MGTLAQGTLFRPQSVFVDIFDDNTDFLPDLIPITESYRIFAQPLVHRFLILSSSFKNKFHAVDAASTISS